MDTIFKSLADPARRTLLDSLRAKDGQTLQELQGQLDMTRFGVMKHLAVLEDAGLIVTRKKGRFKHHYLNAVPLQQAIDRWIEPLLVKPAARAVLDLKSKLEGNATMGQPDFVMQIFIKCSQDALWEALLDANVQSATDFVSARAERKGNTLTYFLPEDEVMLICTETELTPKTRVAATFEPKWEPDLPASRYVYLIEPQGDHCGLTLEHYELPPGQEDVRDGWARTLSGLKTWLETGQAHKFAGDH
ncbi:metalloregulator ArsR/SmtB family transcription factor [Thalassococcus sp. S3]|uniref:ArsR/SmtB family transcription factor n=1 Tax=Thalassococcus sp. S3 TaxID=2017482 RepID=UPI0010241351|nr:metalloregulator ArsR/SmtB family transcription factor [Thalassococcus sp. S3]QBF32786.1 ArsR family transcriptional regulator [Thalassococcus sp. S3]